MKAVITFILFFFFLLIRSGNSHELMTDSYRPAISFMQQHNVQDLKVKSNTSVQQAISSSKTNGHNTVDEHLLYTNENEDLQSANDFQMQMALFATLVCFTFVFVQVGRKAEELPRFSYQLSYDTPLYLTKRALLI
ncbi:hypothetical protein GQF61_04585 [Sphingobacterium sp. DK4209]|uniref:Uncharacterized protein n=1 Tax=Sphingobacterium zhuxiongii TaxID=2662364 RepID=A0A5Q0Q9G4_9SPHI|nr:MULTISPECIES: hypothetical protein [unclassified Sphingobacterium]MVZ65118.1 hypothetical protein [Sphingobacterium sp. DK4209]QGA26066.1 hypothetical protein GFH32_06915 [Sphingobacterium sp. dk4302]